MFNVFKMYGVVIDEDFTLKKFLESELTKYQYEVIGYTDTVTCIGTRDGESIVLDDGIPLYVEGDYKKTVTKQDLINIVDNVTFNYNNGEMSFSFDNGKLACCSGKGKYVSVGELHAGVVCTEPPKGIVAKSFDTYYNIMLVPNDDVDNAFISITLEPESNVITEIGISFYNNIESL